MNCEVLTGANAGYAFHVVYRNELTLEGEPSDTTGLIVSRKRTETTTQKQMVETKVPVEVEKNSANRSIYLLWLAGAGRFCILIMMSMARKCQEHR